MLITEYKLHVTKEVLSLPACFLLLPQRTASVIPSSFFRVLRFFQLLLFFQDGRAGRNGCFVITRLKKRWCHHQGPTPHPRTAGPALFWFGGGVRTLKLSYGPCLQEIASMYVTKSLSARSALLPPDAPQNRQRDQEPLLLYHAQAAEAGRAKRRARGDPHWQH